MLNLFSYGEDEEDNKHDFQESTVSNHEEVNDESESMSSPAPTSLFAAVPTAKKTKKTIKNKKKKLLDIAKFAKVSVEELMKEFQNEPVPSETTKKSPVSSLSFLPAPLHSSTNLSEDEKKEVISGEGDVVFGNGDIVSERKDVVHGDADVVHGDSDLGNRNGDVGSGKGHTIHGGEDATAGEEDPFSKTDGVIPLNPFLSDFEAIQAGHGQEEVTTPFVYTTVTREPKTTSVRESPPPLMSTNEVVQHGYGGNFSQSQYEAFIRRSGMLATANAATSSSANLLGEDAKYYDKQTKRALEEGSIRELNQNDLHDHNDQPGNEYWEKKRKRQVVAEEFGKYAHIAPTQVQQTRNQITSLAAEAIVALAEQDERRAQMRKTKREIRAKYGW